ncbi:hypothetical protein C1H46_030730 [Malus baccata]|uniref:Uncharacterized protein n=1 Tax=Malus baccata TaxID=106549 RepID=A0A540LB71_MALBA|nr:hypothetical protein C1H46_030730 [Malus baccata]
MRLNGEVLSCNGGRAAEEESGENERELHSIVSVGISQPPKLVVGYALTSKKKKSFLQPKFVGLARNKGIFFIAIDVNKPLSDQGPFDVVLHKDYRQKHPEVTVLDPPNSVKNLYNRQSMLQEVADLNLSDCHGKVGVPKQLIVTKDPSSIPNEVDKAGLKLPLGYLGRMLCIAILIGRKQASLNNLGLRLFNVDMIREHGTKDVFYVIDINYFPGYGKMPDYEHIFTDFLLGLVQSKHKRIPAT